MIPYSVTIDDRKFEFKIVRRVLTYSVLYKDNSVLVNGFRTALAAKRWAKYWALNYEALDNEGE